MTDKNLPRSIHDQADRARHEITATLDVFEWTQIGWALQEYADNCARKSAKLLRGAKNADEVAAEAGDLSKEALDANALYAKVKALRQGGEGPQL